MLSPLIRKLTPKKDIHAGTAPAPHLPSIAFVSFHKCATTYFTSEILNKHASYIQIDYQKHLASNGKPVSYTVRPSGYAYGVLRILEPGHPLYPATQKVIDRALKEELPFLFWVRDPRDILVSMYYSFGFSHGTSKVETLAVYQQKRRAAIQQQTLETYVLSTADELAEKFLYMHALMQRSSHTLLRYEDMIDDFDTFKTQIDRVFTLDPTIYQKIYNDTRPQAQENTTSHRRSGRTGQYRDKLSDACIHRLNEKLANVLEIFDYPIA